MIKWGMALALEIANQSKWVKNNISDVFENDYSVCKNI